MDFNLIILYFCVLWLWCPIFAWSQALLRREQLKLVDGGESQRTFVYIKDAIEAVLLMIVRVNYPPHPLFFLKKKIYLMVWFLYRKILTGPTVIFLMLATLTMKSLLGSLLKWWQRWGVVLVFSFMLMTTVLPSSLPPEIDALTFLVTGLRKRKWRTCTGGTHSWCQLQRVLRWRIWR